MAKVVFPQNDVKGISPHQWERIAKVVSTREQLQPHDLAAASGISREKAIAIMSRLTTLGLAKMYVLLYHGDEEVPFEARPYEGGYPTIREPLHCDNCDGELESEEDVSFDVMARLEPGARIAWPKP